MKALPLYIMAVLLLSGCSGMENVYHKEGDHFKNWRVKYSPHPFSPSVERDYNETCPPLANNPKRPDLENCTPDSKPDGSIGYEMAKEPSYLSGFGGSVLQAGAIAFAGHQIGRGLGHSGSQTQVNQNGGGATASGGYANSSSTGDTTINLRTMGHGRD